VLDEIKKAHPDAHNVLLQIFQRRLRTGEETGPVLLRAELMEPLRAHFRRKLINGLDEIIVFHALTREQIRQIGEVKLERVRRAACGQGVELEIDGSRVEHIADAGYQPEFGAGELRRLIRATLETELAGEMLAGDIRDGHHVRRPLRGPRNPRRPPFPKPKETRHGEEPSHPLPFH
jgi:ATP-dependent Clp protease ATP-binding subunit ClpC